MSAAVVGFSSELDEIHNGLAKVKFDVAWSKCSTGYSKLRTIVLALTRI